MFLEVGLSQCSKQFRPGGRSGQVVQSVEPGSIAEELGILPGDRLLSVNGEPVADVFAYRLAVMDTEIVLEMADAAGEPVLYEIEKDEDESLGLVFEDALMDRSRHCHNRCVFCFIDQLPPGMRETLYFKDDDMRLSFLTGNYITLTNLSDAELDRLIGYHLSPMNISVHATDPECRRLMLKNPRSTAILSQLRRIAAAGIDINAQIVLCPGINDGAILERTLTDLAEFGDQLLSVAAVPVGITRYRDANGLTRLERFDVRRASDVVRQTRRWQQFFMERLGRRVFFAADEFYVRAGLPLPPAADYENMPQLENGVGMLALLNAELDDGLAARTSNGAAAAEPGPAPRGIFGRLPDQVRSVHLLTGTDAAPYLARFRERLQKCYNFSVFVHPVENRFFGSTITVAGLLTGQDLTAAGQSVLSGVSAGERERAVILLPDCMLKQDEDVFLDDWTPDDLSRAFGVPVVIGRETGLGLLGALDRLTGRNEANYG